MTDWTDPKTWVTGEVLTDDDFNTYIRDNMVHLKAGNVAMVEVRNGVSDFLLSSPAGWAALFPSVFRLKISTVGRDLHIESNFDLYTSTDGAILSVDYRIRPLDGSGAFFVSSGTGTPTTRGIASYTTQTGNSVSTSVSWIQRGLPAGGYVIHVFLKMSAGTIAINLTNHVNQFMVREYGVAR